MKIYDIFSQFGEKIERLDLELIISHVIKKTREFVLTYPDSTITKKQETITKKLIVRRLKHEPMAYILGQKEFYGLPFKVDKNTLIPRPETEFIVEKVLSLNPDGKNIVDIGTGSGNIIIALTKNLKNKNIFFGIDISPKALRISKQNAKLNKVEKKIKFFKGNLLQPLLKKNLHNSIIIANLPYLSEKIYGETMPDVKNFEPKSALHSAQEGLAHYKKLFTQIKKLSNLKSQISILIEFSPEQKKSLNILVKKFFPQARNTFYKDLAHKWRVLEIHI